MDMYSLPLAIFGAGPWELGLLALVGLLLFGSRLPSAMKGLGRSFGAFRDGLNDVNREIEEATR